jgi:Uma2 family endonuclease
MTETEVVFEDHEVYRPDVTGWRRERMPELPEEIPVTLRPDWVCEILSPSNARNDIVKKMLTYQRARVPHYWLIEPVTEALVVYRWTEAGYLLVQSAQGEERIRAEPFDGVSLSVRSLLEGDETED